MATLISHLASPLHLLPSKTLFIEAINTIIAADVHLGKAETFQSYGIPVPSGHSEKDLMRLSDAVTSCGAKRLIILGDFLHSSEGLTPELEQVIRAWSDDLRSRHIRPEIVLGNHDRTISFTETMGITPFESLCEGMFRFSHHPEVINGVLNFSGHIHPSICLGGKQSRLRLPCFLVSPELIILPAFGEFTGTAEADVEGFIPYVVTDGGVIEWHPDADRQKRKREKLSIAKHLNARHH